MKRNQRTVQEQVDRMRSKFVYDVNRLADENDRLHELDELMQRKVKRLEDELLEANEKILKLEIEHE
jgi:hypothetical protein